MKYDYYEEVKNDVRIYIRENYSEEEQKEKLQDREEWEGELNDELWIEDNVTGNASGSYTFNTYRAEENLCHNMDLLEEALNEFGCGIEYLKKGAEACDVTIRCYLLGVSIYEVLNELEEDMEE